MAQGTVEFSLRRDADCPLAEGTLSMRGPDKRWYRTELDCSGCGPLDLFPLTDVLSIVLSGDGSCAEVAWSLFGISIPGWTLLGFMALLAVGVWQIFQPKI